MAKAEAILRRLPDFYGALEPDPALDRPGVPTLPGKLLYRVVSALARPLDELDIAAAQAARAHWVRQAPELLDLELLAALFNIRRYDGEERERFRRRLVRLIRVYLQGLGTVPAVLQVAAATLDLDVWDALGRLRLAPSDEPFVTRAAVAGRIGYLEVHENVRRAVEPPPEPRVNGAQWEVRSQDFDPVVPTIAITGVGARTVEPLLINLITGEAAGVSEAVPDGHELVLYPDGTAAIEGRDATARLYTLRGAFAGLDRFDTKRADFTAGTPDAAFERAAFDRDRFPAVPQPGQMPRLAVGRNLWYFTAQRGRFDRTPLDRSVYAAPTLPDGEGRFGIGRLDNAIFQQLPSAQVQVRWQERQRTSFELRLPWSFIAHGPEEVAVGRRLYRVDSVDNRLQVLDLNGVLLGSIPVGQEPCTLREVRFRLPGATQDTRHVYLANRAGGTLSVVGTVQVEAFLRGEEGAAAERAVLATLPVGAGPCSLAVLPDGSRVYVANAESGTLSIVDVMRVMDVIAGTAPPESAVQSLAVGTRPGRLAITRTSLGFEVRVTNFEDRTISVIAVSGPGQTEHRVALTQRAALPHDQLAAALDAIRPAGVRSSVTVVAPPLPERMRTAARAQSGV